MPKSKTKKKSTPAKKQIQARAQQQDTGEAVLRIGMGAVVALLIMTGAIYGIAAYRPEAREKPFFEIFQYLPALVGAAGSFSGRWTKKLLGGDRSDLFYAVAASAILAVILSVIFIIAVLVG